MLVCSHDSRLTVGDLAGDAAAFLRQLIVPFVAGVWVSTRCSGALPVCVLNLSLTIHAGNVYLSPVSTRWGENTQGHRHWGSNVSCQAHSRRCVDVTTLVS